MSITTDFILKEVPELKSKNLLINKIYQAYNVMICDSKLSRNYGTGDTLSFSEISLLVCVRNNAGANAGGISSCLGITKGAVTQFAKKLKDKELLIQYRIEGNNKEVYYRLTPAGETACKGYDAHYGKIRSAVKEYTETLDEQTAGKVEKLFDIIIQNASSGKNCYVLDGEKGEKGRCEKCKNFY